jgi:cell filamentation protein
MAEYDSIEDPYCYPGTSVLRNRPGIRDAAALAAFEAEITHQRAAEPLPHGRLSVTHYRAIHRHLFQDVYAWAGRFRSVRIEKDGSMFCYPEHIGQQMRALFASLHAAFFLRGLPPQGFAKQAAHFLAELNAIHPFREGNGRSQLVFLLVLAEYAGYPLDLSRLAPRTFLAAMVNSFQGNEGPLQRRIEDLFVR